ncbi:MAG: gluconate 2-dehydrogenase subunit 3 family protein [Saprospiraceae bacterium]|nr:gluconate 2-dehydrogenase subunit 3 family protein [Saprospiraceae bacterium]MCB9317985.1 gluconate 2-dehydrogenase subunit 3 family protein [Lewinellaceae bacterium]
MSLSRREALQQSGWILAGVLSAGSIASLVSGCNQSTPSVLGDWTPAALNMDQANLLAELAETIVPKTKTPGATDAQVTQTIDDTLNLIVSDEEKQRFLDGLAQVDAESDKQFGKKFTSLSSPDREKVVQTLADAAKQSGAPNNFQMVYQMIVFSFCTSEIACKEVFKIDQIPGSYQGCIPFSDVGKVWAPI